MKEYDLFLPLTYNDGTRIEPEFYSTLRKRLLEHFDGVTYCPQPNEGYWRMGEVTYKDEIIIFRIVAANKGRARRYLRALKEELKRSLDQEEIFIVERDVRTL